MPRTVQRHFQKGPFKGEREYLIYTVEEAKRLPEDAPGAFYVPWWEAKVGDWALSDDGLVLQCVRRRHYPKSTIVSGAFWFTLGRMWATFDKKTGERRGTTPFHVEPFFGEGVPKSSFSPRPWHEQEGRSNRVKMAVALLVRFMVGTKNKLTQEQWEEVAAIGFAKHQIPRAAFFRWYKTATAKTMIADELQKLLDGQEITAEQTLKMYKDLFDDAVKGRSFGVAKGILDKFAELTDLTRDTSPQLPAWQEGGDDVFDNFLTASEAEDADFELLPEADADTDLQEAA